jgi:hypothetical protein
VPGQPRRHIQFSSSRIGTACHWRAATHLLSSLAGDRGLDLVELADPLERLFGDRRSALLELALACNVTTPNFLLDTRPV